MGLRKISLGYLLLSVGVGISVASATWTSRSFAVLVFAPALPAFFGAILLIPTGLMRTTEPVQSQIYQMRVRMYQRIIFWATIGGVSCIVFILPIAVVSLSPQIAITSLFGVSLSLFLIVFSITGIASYIAMHTGAKNMRRTALIARAIAYPVFAMLIASTITLTIAWQSLGNKHLGLTDTQWEYLHLISLAALTLLHAAFTFYFWRKLKSKLNISPPPPAPPAA